MSWILGTSDEAMDPEGARVSQLLKVHCFNVTRDGFGAGVGQSLDHPFGHGANPADLFSWAGATASWVNRTDPGGTRGLDDYFTRDFTHNIGAEPRHSTAARQSTAPYPSSISNSP